MMEKEHKHLGAFLSGIIKENPLLVGLLGFCPALAVTTSLESAFGMGVLFTVVLTCSNLIVSLLRKIIPEEVRTPCYIVVIATFVTIVKMLCEAFLPELYSSLGVFLSLIVVNCIVLGRAEAYASSHPVGDSVLDGLGNGIGYMLAICLIALIRELLGSGQLTFGKTFTFIAEANGGSPFVIPLLKGNGYNLSISFFAEPAGAFLVLAIVLAVLAAITQARKNKARVDARVAKQAALKAKEEAK